MLYFIECLFFFFSSRRRHTRCLSDWSSDVCSSDLLVAVRNAHHPVEAVGARHRFDGIGDQLAGGQGVVHPRMARSEERRVGKEGRSRWRADDGNRKKVEKRKSGACMNEAMNADEGG